MTTMKLDDSPITIAQALERSALLFPEKPAVVTEEGAISYLELRKLSRSLAGSLARRGLRKGDRVGLLVDKTPEAIIAFLGIAEAGGVFVPLDHHQPAAALQATLDLTAPAGLIVSATHLRRLGELRLPCLPGRVVLIGAPVEGEYVAWDEALREGSGGFEAPVIGAEDLTYLNMTSGTTGAPKAALTTHANIYWNTLASTMSLGLTSDDVHLCLFPVFGHPHELFARPLVLGGTMVIARDSSPGAVLKAVSDHGATCIMGAASLYGALARHGELHPVRLPTLRLAESGGMPVSRELAGRFRERFGVPIVPVWGSTETTGIAFASPLDGGKPGAMGRICPTYEAKIVDDDGRELSVDQVGELAIRGPAVCAGYYGNPAETARRFREGWFFTGDMVRKDPDGYHFFDGRQDAMMKVAGLKVFPLEIENVLLTHPGVHEAAVIGVPHGTHGVVPKAVVVKKPDIDVTETEIRRYCETRLPGFKIPRLVCFVPELPKSPSGKILYRNLQPS